MIHACFLICYVELRDTMDKLSANQNYLTSPTPQVIITAGHPYVSICKIVALLLMPGYISIWVDRRLWENGVLMSGCKLITKW